MRLIWTGFLLTGLLLTGLSAYESGQTREEPVTPMMVATEDGTPMPPPDRK